MWGVVIYVCVVKASIGRRCQLLCMGPAFFTSVQSVMRAFAEGVVWCMCAVEIGQSRAIGRIPGAEHLPCPTSVGQPVRQGWYARQNKGENVDAAEICCSW